uniref:Glutathione peroxidase n=1 Tax=Equus asinus TaxID=9793 RepID=A0A9L0IB87_EQUAS
LCASLCECACASACPFTGLCVCLSFVFATQVSLVVNVASECGFTDQHYRALQQLQRDLGPHHFNVLAFPCNQFGQQEPDSNKEIESFARRTYSVSFPMFSKIAVVGTGAHPAFKYLTRRASLGNLNFALGVNPNVCFFFLCVFISSSPVPIVIDQTWPCFRSTWGALKNALA